MELIRRRTSRPTLLIAFGFAVALAGLGSAFAGAQGEGERRGTDPLSFAEVEAALDAADVPAPAAAPDEADPESLASNGLPQQVVLLVERHFEEKTAAGDPRRADVYEYSYSDDTLTIEVVDLRDESVDESSSVQGTQLPLIEVEQRRALALLLADEGFRAILATELEAVTGRPVPDPAAILDAQPIIFRADAVPGVSQGAVMACGVHRCAQFLLQTNDHLLVNLFPIVDLSEGVVLSPDASATS